MENYVVKLKCDKLEKRLQVLEQAITLPNATASKESKEKEIPKEKEIEEKVENTEEK